ncbi:YlxR family protein [Aminipila butyrica]|uniref:YlxR family protein n=1 Tax=Aminipila butyrica TaxID=433296 RepID=A0A858BUK4_9FIRM|nr:YlxR family protein [Aminipila butyrica]QIB69042.1 YlxR family protein [Aminipila butyrica]
MKTKKIPMRRCVGCMESKPKTQLLRIAGYEGHVSVDLTGKAKGRGVYLCPDTQCFEKAQKRRAIGRNLEMELSSEQLESLFEELKKYEEKNR